MEPVTHFLTGACIGRAGLNRKTAYATLAATLAAEAADLDMFWEFAGPVKEIQHHRGFTHTFLGATAVAGVVVGAIWIGHFAAEKRRAGKCAAVEARVAVTVPGSEPEAIPPARGPVPVPRGRQPVRWGWLYATALIAALSHILLDWMNNYGVRPFYPFSGRWYEGSFMFIVEPVLLGILALAVIMPWLFGLADREIGARRKPFRGRGWAIFSLSAFAALAGVRWWQHDVAINLARNAAITLDPIERIAAEPYPVNPFRWHVLVETPSYYQTAEVNTWAGSVDTDPKLETIYKPAVTPAVEAAKRTYLGSVYMGWSRWPLVEDMGQEPALGIDPPPLPPGRTWTTVRFSDLRFQYPILGIRPSNHWPLTGWVYIVDGREAAGEAMDGRQQK
ncbi:MAG TPA: metal-dependent hydrolase [Terracidiphilus sp.]|nr:metal-dependent hydrolase [Terracidiphilus sp.]